MSLLSNFKKQTKKTPHRQQVVAELAEASWQHGCTASAALASVSLAPLRSIEKKKKETNYTFFPSTVVSAYLDIVALAVLRDSFQISEAVQQRASSRWNLLFQKHL